MKNKSIKKISLSLLLLTLIVGVSITDSNNLFNTNPTKKVMNIDFSNPTKELVYELSDDESYYIVASHQPIWSGKVVIPEEYNNLPVKEIASEAFVERTWISSIAIPKTIEKIGSGAFSMTGLKEIYFNAANCEDFRGRNWIFYPNDTTQDIAITIGKDVERIPERMFFPLSVDPTKKPNVNSLIFEENSSLKEIGDYAFYQLEKIKNVEFPDSLINIGDYAFYGCGIETFSFSSNLETIGKYCFANNTSLKDFTLPTSIKEINEGAFKNCKSLENLVINSEINVSDEAFKYCTSLKTVTLQNVKSIGNKVFEECKELKNIDLGENLTSIGKAAFKNCLGITQLTLPKSLSILNEEAFYNLSNVTSLIINCSQLENLTSGNKVFYNLGTNTDGVKVVFNSNVKVIPSQLFASCSNEANLPNINEIVIYSGELANIRNWAFGYLNANVTFVGKISEWKNIEIEEGNMTLSKVNCVKSYEEVA